MGIGTIELFAGAGGLGLGARAAGADVRLVVEFDPIACETLRLNARDHGGRVLEADVCSLGGSELRSLARVRRSEKLLITGGPPCQPFSKAAYWVDPGEEAKYRRARERGETMPRPSAPPVRPDERRSLVQEFFRLIVEADADAFVFENVPSITHPRNRPVLDWLIASAEAAGFATTLVRTNAVDFGVAQRRERVVLLASRLRQPTTPAATHSEDAATGLLPLVTAGEALRTCADAPPEPEEVVVGRWAEHLRTVPPGWNYKAHTAWGGHPNPTFVTETRFWNFLLKLSPDLPSWTIPANPGPWIGPFHWESRRLRTPELGVLQGFPPNYEYAGSRRERVRQIGNAMPPPLAEKMVASVLETLAGRRSRRRRVQRGQLPLPLPASLARTA
ncbi:MAG: DNA cytosine methyltransferase [Acidobacteria bacterium]|nr:DNA cytosine methyltransferase [Acidobacteriota bacterium]